MLKDLAQKSECYKKLSASLKAGRLFHATMLVGSDTEEMSMIAKLLSADILLDGHGEEKREQVTHKVLSSIHPDLKEYGVDKPLDAEGAREITSAACVMPYEGINKVYIIHNFDDIGSSPANILLKTIEEPPTGCYFLLLVKNENRVLQTILSRSQRFYVDPVSHEDIVALLTEKNVSNPDMVAMQSMGSITRALSIASGGNANVVTNFVLDALLNLNQTTKFGEYAAKLEKEKGNLASIVEFFSVVCTDIIKLKLGKENLVRVKGLKQRLVEIAPYHTINGLVMIIDAAVRARDMIDKKINAINIIDQFLLKIVEVRVKCKR